MSVLNITVAAHVDHGKSTLSTRLVTAFRNVDILDLQFTDNLPVEKERGITVRSQVINLMRTEDTVINIIDTPGHFDFQGEVLKALAITDLVLLVISTREGPQAQTYKYLEAAKTLGKPIWIILNQFKPMTYPQLMACLEAIRKSPFTDEDGKSFHENFQFCCAKDGDGIERLKDSLIDYAERI